MDTSRSALFVALILSFSFLYTPASFACSDFCLLQKPAQLASSQRLAVVAVGDVNNDGRNDIVAVSDDFGDGYGVHVYLQGADGVMQPPLSYFPAASDTVLPTGRAVAVGDVNGDGRKDVVVTTNQGFRVMLQDTQGKLGTIVDYSTAIKSQLRLGDISGDGRLDVVTAQGTTVNVFQQNASGTFNSPTSYSVPEAGVKEIELADMNNDGRLDIVLMSSGYYTYRDLTVLLQDFAGGFQAPAYYDMPNTDNAAGLGVGDINGDGRNDAVLTDDWATSIIVYTQNASGSLNPPVSYPSGDTGYRPLAVDMSDINGDGRADVIVLAQYGIIYAHLQNSDGTLAPVKLHGIGHATSANSPYSLAVGDVNGDGKPDVIVAKDLSLGDGVDVHYATRANLRMTLVADQSSGLVGKPVRYTATIVNDGPDVATDVRLATSTPNGMFTSGSLANSQGTCNDVLRTCSLGAMAVGQTATVAYEAYAYDQPGSYTTTATLTAFNYDGDTSDSTLSATTTFAASADLQIYSHTVSSPASAQVSYYIVVFNDGKSEAQGVTVTDTLPAGVTPTAASWRETWGGSRSGSCQIAGSQVQCSIGTLGVTDIFSARYPVAVTINGQVTTSDNLLNTATVSATTGDPDESSNVSSRLSTAQGSAFNQAPVLVSGSPYTARLGASTVLDARASRDPEGKRLSYTWTFPNGSQAWDARGRFTFTTLGINSVTLSATDDLGAVSTQTVSVNVVDTAPVAIVASPFNYVRKNSQTYLYAGRSYDVDGGALTYGWDFGDGTVGTGVQVFPTYTRTGEYTARLTVGDGSASASATATIFVVNTPPSASAGGRYYAQKNGAVTFDGSYSVDGNNDPLTYRWNFGDGTTGSGVRPVHTYGRSGNYTVTLVVNDGEVDSAPSTATAIISNNPPVANGGGPYTAVKGQAATFDGSASYDPDSLDTLTYKWNFGDGTTGSGVKPTHVYTKSGRVSLTLTVNDGEVDSTVYKTTVDVKNR